MPSATIDHRSRQLSRLRPFLLVPLLALGAPALADPPPWAPAHGYYKKKPGHKPPRFIPKRVAPLPWLAGAATAGYLSGSRCNREALGTVLGGVLGGVAGARLSDDRHRSAATIAGTLIGALVGRSIGRSMDQLDQACTGQTLEYAPDNQAVTWQNPDTGASYTVTPTRTYEAGDGRYCREYISQASIGGQEQQVQGTACRQPDGSWKIVDR
ncbi:RT0821/Lpp0805 family surface protein [Thiohalobacter sp. IOR34]|uniref:RT0821/Lpp0805 family surface protein n=1 Tax=Thiohalobacter sp. IOR34 TaxID=3057176 RepID=UPI0025AED217|nr:RT0821/Lpp0805 family surface protein [Thiohalobacter sp. IOR34]WJW74288.1 RT0821/Lpp0805 family surface protein [Thiohalobacter sp. IOR34]